MKKFIFIILLSNFAYSGIFDFMELGVNAVIQTVRIAEEENQRKQQEEKRRLEVYKQNMINDFHKLKKRYIEWNLDKSFEEYELLVDEFKTKYPESEYISELENIKTELFNKIKAKNEAKILEEKENTLVKLVEINEDVKTKKFENKEDISEEEIKPEVNKKHSNKKNKLGKPKKQAKKHIHFNNCREAHAAGYYNIRKGEPGYNPRLDRDGDGLACE